jgi:hypothetical protein
MIKIFLCSVMIFLVANNSFAQKNTNQTVREEWLYYLDKIARPVLANLSADKLKENMQIILSEKVDNKIERKQDAYLEAFARTLSGIAPWLQLDSGSDNEVKLRNEFRKMALVSLSNVVNPNAKDYVPYIGGGQHLVDASFLALALNRCPWLWENSDSITKKNTVNFFLTTRNIVPVYSNWLLFTAMIETFFCQYNLPYDKVRIDFALKEFINHWYTGDGLYSDGNEFHVDYYNSFVIQPYLQCIFSVINKKAISYKNYAFTFNKISKRYAILQERCINADGTFLVVGRSITYRGGAFHHLANMALQQQLPDELKAPQIRAALTAVLRKTINAPKTFTDKGWLNIGLCGSQPNLAEGYINTGSLYLCSQIFLPLGLPVTNDFWSKPEMPWTAVKIWSGEDVPADHAMELEKEK